MQQTPEKPAGEARERMKEEHKERGDLPPGGATETQVKGRWGGKNMEKRRKRPEINDTQTTGNPYQETNSCLPSRVWCFHFYRLIFASFSTIQIFVHLILDQ